MKFLLCAPDGFMEEVDALAEKESRSRSELVREALRQYIRQAKAHEDIANA